MKMRYLSQENEVYNLNIRKYGCYFLCILRIIEELNNREFEHSEVEVFYKEFLTKGFILPNCRVLSPDSIFKYFGIYVQTKKESLGYSLNNIDLSYFVSHIKTSFLTGHFVLCKGILAKKLEINDKIWDSLFLTQNNHSLCIDAFRIFTKV